jgi:hypothetical protein
MSRPVATFITFLVSSIAHELVMGCITRKFRGYGFFAMMLQMPIVLIQRSPWIRNRTILNNVLFWCSMISGLSMVGYILLFPKRMVADFLGRYVRCTSWCRSSRESYPGFPGPESNTLHSRVSKAQFWRGLTIPS